MNHTPDPPLCTQPGVNPDWWFPTRTETTWKLAIAICNGCPQRIPCLEGAVARNERHGIWGGRAFGNADTRRRIHAEVRAS